MSRSPAERVDAPLRWLRANKHDLGPLTGQDTRALLAIAAAWRLYCNSDDHGQPATLRAIDELLHCMQPKCWRFARAVIPWAADWSHERQWWDRLVVVNPTIGLVNVDHIHPRGRCPAEEISSRDFLVVPSTQPQRGRFQVRPERDGICVHCQQDIAAHDGIGGACPTAPAVQS